MLKSELEAQITKRNAQLSILTRDVKSLQAEVANLSRSLESAQGNLKREKETVANGDLALKNIRSTIELVVQLRYPDHPISRAASMYEDYAPSTLINAAGEEVCQIEPEGCITLKLLHKQAS